ncbi:MAG: phytoene/squalene synthase family protein [Bacteroidota bacterium]
MEALYHQTTFECAKLITQRYSTSFTLGIKTLHKKYHLPIYAVYGFVRYADEIVDTFHEFDKARLLKEFTQDTYKAIEEGISFNPVLHAFQRVVNEYKIERELIDAFLRSMEMDLTETVYNQSEYEEYIYGSAEVVGLMCLRIFCEGDEEQYQRLREPARRLGSAFQKVNFLRDVKSDYQDRGRVYFPGVDFSQFTPNDKLAIERDIQEDFDAALEGIKNLPFGARQGVYLAYIYYLKLFQKIKGLPVKMIQNHRIRIPDGRKMWLLLKSVARHRLNAI